jgi:phosphate butyryltransferase
VACPADSHTEEVIERSIAEQFARFTLVANTAKADIARRLAADYPDKVTLIVADDDDDAARHAVKEVREGRADVLMKGEACELFRDASFDNFLCVRVGRTCHCYSYDSLG